jgi:predicted HTH domain antitoxin
MSHAFSVAFGDDVLLATGLSPSEFSREAKFLLAAKFYELGRLSSGKAAKLCERERVDFLLSLRAIGVSVSNLSEDDLTHELGFSRGG